MKAKSGEGMYLLEEEGENAVDEGLGADLNRAQELVVVLVEKQLVRGEEEWQGLWG